MSERGAVVRQQPLGGGLIEELEERRKDSLAPFLGASRT